MIDTLTFILSLAGFAALLLAMARHQQAWLHRKLPPNARRVLRIGGFIALALALVIAVAGLGWGYGTVTWFGWTTIAAVLMVSANTYREYGASRRDAARAARPRSDPRSESATAAMPHGVAG